MRPLVAAAALALGSCSDPSAAPPTSATFWFGGTIAADSLLLEITNPAGLAQAESLLVSGEQRWASGVVVRGDGGFNAPWTWHLDPATVEFAEVTIEACQTDPPGVEAELDYWIGFGRTCFWGGVTRRER